ncbi:MAG: MBL fold metallo-hydrolase [Bacteroidota bacterium]|nr:MBL fold metallo-hydrolase [Bacteroidota bacterium]
MSKKNGKLYFLGTGTSQGIPVIGCKCDTCLSNNPKDKRFRSSVHVVYNGNNIQIDTGPDFRTQLLHNNITNVDAILFTHEHQDHIAGLDDVRPIIFKTGLAMPIYGQNRVINRIRKVYDYAFRKQTYPGAPRIVTHTINDSSPFFINGVEVIPIPLIHGQLPILGYRIGEMAYLTDTNMIPEKSMSLLCDLDLLILDALHHNKHFSHFNLEQALLQAEKIGARQTYFIHMSHHMGTHDLVEDQLPRGMNLAYDGLEVEFS